MSISFHNIPQNLRVPLFYAEVDNSQANTALQSQRALIVAQMLTAGGGAGTATPGIPVYCQGVAWAKGAFGQGSDAALAVAAYRANDSFGELWVLPLQDDGSGVAATGIIDCTAVPTAGGTLPLYVDGVPLPIPVTSSMIASDVAAAITAAINANADLPVTAVQGTSTNAHKTNLTAKNAGPTGNDVDIRLAYLGAQAGEVMPAGLAITITAMSGGSIVPSLATPLANLASQPFDFIVLPYTDSTSLNTLKTFLSDTTGRWSWEVQIYGHVFAALKGTVGALTTAGAARNDQHASILGVNDSPSRALIWAAAYAGASSVSLRADPGVPLQALSVAGVLAPPLQSRFALTDQNALLFSGISTFTVGDDGTVFLQNVITTYQKNAFGAADNSYLEIETLFLLAFVLRTLAGLVTSKYARVKLAADGTRLAPGSGVITPSQIRADLIAKYRELEAAGYVQNGDAFKTALIVQKNTSNPNRVDVLWPGTLINQLRIFALLAQFRLS